MRYSDFKIAETNARLQKRLNDWMSQYVTWQEFKNQSTTTSMVGDKNITSPAFDKSMKDQKAQLDREAEFFRQNGFENQEASALKSSTGWLPSSGNGINAIGFNGLPNGYINAFGGPTLGQGICTWATTNVNTDLPLGSRTRVLVQLFNTENIFYDNNAIQIGAGIRCIKE